MHTRVGVAALVGFSVVAAGRAVNGGEPLRLQVSPTMTRAPADVTVRVSIEAAADNRLLEVVAESADFYRSSQIPIDGANAPPLSVFEFRNLPTGLYQVTGVLVRAGGQRSSVSRIAKVEPAFGR
jgi:hypothetical protein